jgi:hypothetical protein
MSTQAPVEVQVVFDASKGRGRRAVRPSTSPKSRPPVRAGSSGLFAVFLGFLSIVVSSGLYYATWWQADPEIYFRLMTKTPVAVDMDAAALMFGIKMPPASTAKSTPSPEPSASVDSDFPTAKWDGRMTQIAIPATAYTWLTTSSISYLLVAMAGGAMVLGGAVRRKIGVVVLALSILGLGGGAYYVYSEFGWYRPSDLRYAMGILVLLAIGLGSVVGRGGRRLARFATLSLILAAVVTGAGLYVGGQCGAVKVEHFTLPFIAMAFAVHAAWGVILFPLSKRL